MSLQRERLLVWLLCGLAAIHVFVFSAAFPFFNSVDEQAHFDLVVKYSHGEIPRAISLTNEEAIPFIAIYGTAEYINPLSAFPDGKVPPPFWVQPEAIRDQVSQTEAFWSRQTNHESSQPPLYYLIAGLWWQLAKPLGLHDGALLYSVRFLNLLFVVGMIWAAYAAAFLVFPRNAFIRVGVPTLMAFLPQTAFYSINNDVLSPLCFGLAFLGVMRLMQTETPDVRLGALTGLAMASCYLAKVSNLPAMFVAFAAIGWTAGRLQRAGKLRAALPALFAMALCVLVPVGGWIAWTKYHFGDFTGSLAKTEFLGWTLKPPGEWWHHPIFSHHGLWKFVTGLIVTFWQGEFLWHGKPMTLSVINLIYVVLTLGFLTAAIASLLARYNITIPLQRWALWFGFWALAASAGFLAFLSVIYDFDDCFYPSRQYPFFTSGRLIGAALVPFLLLFVYGMDCAFSRFKLRLSRFFALAAFVGFMLATEIATDSPLFSNRYNWFHL